MSFTDRSTSILIANADLLSGGLLKLHEEATLTNAGWDSLEVTYAQRVASCTAEALAALFPTGARLGTRTWWLAEAKIANAAAGLFTYSVTFRGWAGSKPSKISVGAAADQSGGENIRAPQYEGDTVGAVYAKLQTHENMPTITVAYLVENTGTLTQTSNVGKALTPPVSIPVPATVWAMLTTYVYHWPNGWVLMGSEQDRLPGTTAALVTDSYKYIREKTPG
jgi:hypothetical protein